MTVGTENQFKDFVNKGEIQKYFSGKTVFITGTTGFIGKMLLEKILRSCPNVKKIYILIREKKGKEPEQRFKEIFDVPAFEPLKKLQPNYVDKVSTFIGDLRMPCLGLTENDKQIIIEDVDCIFHCAATVRFDEKIRTAGYINVRSVRDLLMIAKEMKRLRSFIHVSTAYSHCPRNDIDETYYEPVLSTEKFLNLLEILDDDILDEITPALLKQWPNTYVLTKSIAEEVIQTEGKDLPMAIVRPSIICGSFKEPVTGWIDNIYGPMGIILGAALGLIRTVMCVPSNLADLVPADYVVNSIIAASWQIGSKCSQTQIDNSNEESNKKSPLIYNYVSGYQNPIDWGTYHKKLYILCMMFPSPLVLWHSTFRYNSSKLLHILTRIFTHYLPAYIIDFIAMCIGKEPIMVKAYKKIHKFSNVISYFTLREWRFKNNNVQKLWNTLSEQDKEHFQFDISAMTWDDYLLSCVIGARSYILKDTMDTIPQGRRKLWRLKIAHYTLVTVLLLILWKFFTFIWSCIC